jgi:hypothetical protein
MNRLVKRIEVMESEKSHAAPVRETAIQKPV